MISQTAEYALRAVVFLALNHKSSYTTEQISRVTRVPSPYLSKILQGLVRSGLVHSQRGLRGGFILTKDPQDISILKVVNAVDPMQRIRVCPLGIEDHGVELCPMHRRLDEALAMVEKVFTESTIAELIAQRTGSPLMCSALAGDKNNRCCSS